MVCNQEHNSIKDRIVAVDALRGFSMFLIIGGGAILKTLFEKTNSGLLKGLLPQFEHVLWEGFHFWDLIMPLFMFTVGVTMPFSFKKRFKRGDSKKQLYYHVVKRTVLLFLLGMLAGGNLLTYDLSKLRIYNNTLQAIAVGYLIASILMLNMRTLWQTIATVGILVLFWVLMMLVPIPGYGAGMLMPDKNLGIYLSKVILGQFQGGWKTPWVLSSMTFSSTVMLGVIAGYLLHSEKNERAKVIWLVGLGSCCLVLGLIWNNWFPIIKRLWTSSFVLFAGGWSYLLLALFYLIMEVWGLRKWAFMFVVIGMNSIVAYMATRLFDFRYIGDKFVGGMSNWLGDWNDFVRQIASFIAIWLILLWMYRNRAFLKL